MTLLHYNPAVFENRYHKNSPYLQGRYGLLFIGSKNGLKSNYHAVAISSIVASRLANPPVSQTMQVPRLHSTSEPRG